MGTVEESKRLVKSLSPEKRKLFKEKLIERIMQIQTSEPWNESKSDYDELEHKSFQELCHLLNIVLFQEKLSGIPAWPSELKQQHPRKLRGFRVFLTHKVYQNLGSSLLSETDYELYRKAIEIGLGKYSEHLPAPDETRWGLPLDYFSIHRDDLSLHAAWSKPRTCDDWEGFVLLSHRNAPEISYFHPQEPERMKEFFGLCLEVPIS